MRVLDSPAIKLKAALIPLDSPIHEGVIITHLSTWIPAGDSNPGTHRECAALSPLRYWISVIH